MSTPTVPVTAPLSSAEPVDTAVPRGHSLLAYRKHDGSWTMSVAPSNIDLRGRVPVMRGQGATFNEALGNLKLS